MNVSAQPESQSMGDATEALVIPELIVGLGNPGSKYENTRHNVGFQVIDALAKRWQVNLSENRKFQGWYGETTVGSQRSKVRLLKPTTYMNRSGQSVRAVLDWFKVSPAKILVVYDEMDLPLGRIRLRLSGSAGGHNGMKSIISHVNTQEFPRLRIGIGSPKDENTVTKDAVGHVLGQFSKDEQPILSEVLYLAQDSIELSLKQGVEKSMSLYNGRAVEI
ncbi:MAG: aminoacyl-tRNA hydrolase [Thainema sp.]